MDVHEEILVKSIKVRLKLDRVQTYTLGRVAGVVVHVGKEDRLGELGFDVFSKQSQRVSLNGHTEAEAKERRERKKRQGRAEGKEDDLPRASVTVSACSYFQVEGAVNSVLLCTAKVRQLRNSLPVGSRRLTRCWQDAMPYCTRM